MRESAGAAVAINLQPLPNGQRIVDENGQPTQAFSLYWQRTMDTLLGQVSLQSEVIQALSDTVAAIQAAQDAADAASAAAATAQAEAATATTTAEEITNATSLSNSYVGGLTLGASDTGASVTVTVSAHTRYYPQASGATTSVGVNSGSLPDLGYTITYYVFYDDPARTGGAVTYQATADPAEAAQVGDRHFVGAISTPAAGSPPSTGSGPRPPGVNSYEQLQ